MEKRLNFCIDTEKMKEKAQALKCCAQGDARCAASLERLAEEGDVDAMSALAFDWYREEDKGYDPIKAFFWAQEAAEGGDLDAVIGLGDFYKIGFGTKEDPQKAIECYERAAGQGVPCAMKRLEDYRLEPHDREGDGKEAFEYAYRAANMKDREGMRKLAQCYEEGVGVERDEEQALFWYEQAAEAGDVFSMRGMGRYFQGEEEYETAKEWFEKAATLGDGEALNAIGLMYFNGLFGEEDPWTAVRYFEKSSDADCGTGAANLAKCYEHGWGMAESWKHAVKYYERARNLGDEGARRYLKKQEHFVEALAELLSSIMQGKLASGQKLWADYTRMIESEFLNHPWKQEEIEEFVEKKGGISLEALRKGGKMVDETIIGAVVVPPCEEKYEGAMAAASLVAFPFKVAKFFQVPIAGAGASMAAGSARLIVKGVRSIHNSLKSSLCLIFTNACIYIGDEIRIPYTIIENLMEGEDMQTQEQEQESGQEGVEKSEKIAKNGISQELKSSKGSSINLKITKEEEIWEIPLQKYVGLPSAPVSLFLVAAARFYGDYGNFERELSEEERARLGAITLNALDDECILEYL